MGPNLLLQKIQPFVKLILPLANRHAARTQSNGNTFRATVMVCVILSFQVEEQIQPISSSPSLLKRNGSSTVTVYDLGALFNYFHFAMLAGRKEQLDRKIFFVNGATSVYWICSVFIHNVIAMFT
ncbi:hypothetical protein FKM82_011156 [Ascaphus truei]